MLFLIDDYSLIKELKIGIENVDWGLPDAIKKAREETYKTADYLCSEFYQKATNQNIPFPIYLRNVIAKSPKYLTGLWTALLSYAVSKGIAGYEELEDVAGFLSSDKRNKGFVFQLLNQDGFPSFESAVIFFDKKPETGLSIALNIFAAEQKITRKKIAAKIASIYSDKSVNLQADHLSKVWDKHKLLKLNLKLFNSFPTSLRHDILSNRNATVSILDKTTIKQISSDPKVCRQSPLFEFYLLKKKGKDLRQAIDNRKWSYPGLISLMTVFLTTEIKEHILSVCKKSDYGALDFKDIEQIPDKRLKNAFIFDTVSVTQQKSFLKTLSENEKNDLVEDTPTACWLDILESISSLKQLKVVFGFMNKSGKLKDVLKKYFNQPDYLKNKETDRIALLGAAEFNFEVLFYNQITDYGDFFKRKLDSEMVKTAISLASSNVNITNLIEDLKKPFLRACLKVAPVLTINRFKDIFDLDNSGLKSCKKIILKALVERYPKKIKSIFESRKNAANLKFILNTLTKSESEKCQNLLDIKEDDNRLLWEHILDESAIHPLPGSLRHLICIGKKSYLKKAFDISPGHFYKHAINRLPLKQVLPTAFKYPKAGLYIERVYQRKQLLKELNWIKKKFEDKPTVSVAYETAIAFSLADASFLLFLATKKWKSKDRFEGGIVFNDFYRTYKLPKKSGGSRTITVPDEKLKRLQRKILRNGFEKILVHPATHGFIKNRSIVTNATPHTGKEMIVNLDITGFFPNTGYPLIVQACKKLADGKLSKAAVMLTADICSYNKGLPTGAPTSPYIGNIALHQIDKAISKASAMYSIDYTRYADDLTFSGDGDTKRIIPFVRKVLKDRGYTIDPKKTNIFRKGRRQVVTGLVVNEKPNVPRYIRRRIRAAVHHIQNEQTPHWHKKPVDKSTIEGLIAHLNTVQPREAKKYKKQIKFGRKKKETIVMEKPAQYQVVYGDASKMSIIRSGEVDLILTGPPYFSSETEKLLKIPVSQQNKIERVRSEITAFAMSLRPVYIEMERVLKTSGVLVVQIKDIRYQRFLISLSELHRQMVESTGFNLITRIYWHKKRKRSSALKFRDNPVVGAFRVDDVEDIMVFSRSDIPRLKKNRVELSEEEIEKCWRSPLWDMAPSGRKRRHPHQFSETMVRRIIALYSKKGDLVVDPFVGAGTTLKVAVSMGRRAIGYEIIENYVKTADAVAESSLD